MVQTTVTKPADILTDYVDHYAVREFDSLENDLLKPMQAKHEISVMFMINSKINNFINHAAHPNLYVANKATGPDCVFSGLRTSNKGIVVFKGQVQLLTIHFKPTGFYHLFNISPAEFVNCLGNLGDLLSSRAIRLHEQLQEATTKLKLFSLTNEYLTEQLQRKRIRKTSCSIVLASEFLVQQPCTYSIEKLAYQTGMSLKTFERKFIEQIGIAPRLFERIRRFNNALDKKIKLPDSHWTYICYQTGYYDQTHLIKDFYEFAGATPSYFFRNSPPPAEHITRYH